MKKLILFIVLLNSTAFSAERYTVSIDTIPRIGLVDDAQAAEETFLSRGRYNSAAADTANKGTITFLSNTTVVSGREAIFYREADLSASTVLTDSLNLTTAEYNDHQHNLFYQNKVWFATPTSGDTEVGYYHVVGNSLTRVHKGTIDFYTNDADYSRSFFCPVPGQTNLFYTAGRSTSGAGFFSDISYHLSSDSGITFDGTVPQYLINLPDVTTNRVGGHPIEYDGEIGIATQAYCAEDTLRLYFFKGSDSSQTQIGGTIGDTCSFYRGFAFAATKNYIIQTCPNTPNSGVADYIYQGVINKSSGDWDTTYFDNDTGFTTTGTDADGNILQEHPDSTLIGHFYTKNTGASQKSLFFKYWDEENTEWSQEYLIANNVVPRNGGAFINCMQYVPSNYGFDFRCEYISTDGTNEYIKLATINLTLINIGNKKVMIRK